MWILLRIFFGGLMYWAFQEARLNARGNTLSADVLNAYWVGVVVGLALLNGIVWAPYFGERVSDPLTGGTINAEFTEEKGWLLKMIRYAQNRGWRAITRWLCFVECCRSPWRPTAYIIGLTNARENSWLEKVFATEVFKFNNAQNCLIAYRALKRHGIDPRPHQSPGVNLVLVSEEHEVRETPAAIEVPPAPEPPKIKRNERIKLGLD